MFWTIKSLKLKDIVNTWGKHEKYYFVKYYEKYYCCCEEQFVKVCYDVNVLSRNHVDVFLRASITLAISKNSGKTVVIFTLPKTLVYLRHLYSSTIFVLQVRMDICLDGVFKSKQGSMIPAKKEWVKVFNSCNNR